MAKGVPENGIDEPGAPRAGMVPCELDGLIDGGPVRDSAREANLIEADTEGEKEGRVDAREGAGAVVRKDEVEEPPEPKHAVNDFVREVSVHLGESLRSRRAKQRRRLAPAGLHVPQDAKGELPGRGGPTPLGGPLSSGHDVVLD